VQVHAAEEQFIARQLHIVGDADIADVAAGSGGAHHQFLGADRFDDAVGSGPSSEFFHGGDALVATSFDDVCRAELSGEGLAVRVTADGDDAFSSELLRGQDSEQTDGTVSDDGDAFAGAGLSGNDSEPPGAEHVGGGQQRRYQVVVGQTRVATRVASASGIRAGAAWVSMLPISSAWTQRDW
jgi:hypothetical protein